MHSEQVKKMYAKAADRRKFSELKVCHSNAGFFIGTTYTDADGFTEPGSRDSIYFQSRDEAEKQLGRLEAGEIDYTSPIMRLNP